MPDKPRRLTVSEVRQEIFQVSGRPAQGAGGVAGQIFHDVANCALADAHPASWKQFLTGELDAEKWLDAIYRLLLGPRLNRLQPSLADCGEDVLRLWVATQQFVHWFTGLLRQALDHGTITYDRQRETWIGADSLFQSEIEITKTFDEPGWTSEVILAGRLDQFVRLAPDLWCVVEFKLGGGHAEADAAQICLYHELLGGDASNGSRSSSNSAALLHFGVTHDAQARASEILFDSRAIQQVRPSLMALIGRMAGVLPDANAPTQQSLAIQAVEEPQEPTPAGDAQTEMGQKLERALREYGADAHISGTPRVGPTFVRYLLEPQRGITVSKIEARGAELQVRLGLDQEPIIHRVQGRIAVDVQRRDREYIAFGSLRAALQQPGGAVGSAAVLAGVDLTGVPHKLDLQRECPHILVGGGTGSGKTEWLRVAIASLLVNNSPDTLRLAIVDPKRNAFPDLEGSPYLWRPDALLDAPEKPVLPLLEDLIAEMTRRNGLLKQAAADDLTQLVNKTQMKLPRLVVLVDEFAELLQAGSRRQRDEYEQCFIRIAAVGRAAGIHLILATQRPSRQVVSGNLKANLPGKIAMRVSNRVDSGVLIDQSGAERLLGRGDLLLAGLSSEPIRLQSAYLDPESRRQLFESRP